MTELYKPFMLFSGTSGNYVRASWNQAKSRMGLASRGMVTYKV